MAALRCLDGQGASFTSWSGRRKEIEDESLEELERQLAVAQRELRELKESLQRKKREKKAVVVQHEKIESCSAPVGATDASQTLSVTRDEEASCDDMKLVEVQSVPSDGQIPGGDAEIVGSELSGIALSSSKVETEEQSVPAGMEMSPVDAEAENQDVVGASRVDDASGGVDEIGFEAHQHDGGCLREAGAPRDESLPVDGEEVVQVRYSEEVAQAVISEVAAASEKPGSHLKAGFDAVSLGAGNEGAERLCNEVRRGTGDRYCVSQYDMKETPAQLAVHRDSRHDAGVLVPERQTQESDAGADQLSEVALSDMKGDAACDRATLVVAVYTRSVHTGKGLKAERERRDSEAEADQTACPAREEPGHDSKLQEPEPTPDERSVRSTPRVKGQSKNMSASRPMTSGCRALAADGGPDVATARRKRNAIHARKTSVAQRTMPGRRRQAHVFDPGGRR